MTGAPRTKDEKVIAFTCWSNDPQRIGEKGQCGVVHGRLFSTEKFAREYYSVDYHSTRGDRIVRVVIEDLGDV